MRPGHGDHELRPCGRTVTAVDLSSRSLELARQRAEVFGLQDRITFIEADAERLAEFVEPSPYDLVYSFGVIHHTPHPGRALEQIRRHFVGPDTTFKMMVYYRWAWKVLAILVPRGAWRILETGRGGRAELRGTDRMSGDLYLHTTIGSRVAGAFRFRRRGHVRRSHLSRIALPDYVKYRYVKAFPFNVLPDAGDAGAGTAPRMALCVRHPAPPDGPARDR